ncbi:unnamed protein product [Didymodactylos carnosus]|uniref:Uncharacterized protein n=1 Tax=Didymodactylos carnosus TaxID=1234261 RepID=A0A814PXI5_9BILA|nr:unnamed protein product [Didymodactylos carnosus]CAF3876568.1 unnamed protein product [Didymodactylos carnosus]
MIKRQQQCLRPKVLKSVESLNANDDGTMGVKQLAEAAENLSQIISNQLKTDYSSPRMSLQVSKTTSQKDMLEIDAIQPIHYLIKHPERIPIQAVQQLCEVASKLPIFKLKHMEIKHISTVISISGTSGTRTTSGSGTETYISSPKHSKTMKHSTKNHHQSRATSKLPPKHSQKAAMGTISSDIKNKKYLHVHFSLLSYCISKKALKDRTVSSVSALLNAQKSKSQTEQNLSSSTSKLKVISSVQSTAGPTTHNNYGYTSQLAQPAYVREKLTIHQPIPFMIFRLCCPMGMLPLTSKVAERLGIHVVQQSKTRVHVVSDNNAMNTELSEIHTQ